MVYKQGKIIAQGRLLLQDTFFVADQDAGLLSRSKERRVFLFEQIAIFSEPLDKKKGFSMPGYLFKNSVKVSCLGLEENVENDPSLTSPIEYQKNHVGPSGPNSCSGMISTSRSRPSRIPQPIRHHSPVLVSSGASAQTEVDRLTGDMDSLQRQVHRHSTHSKDTDRMSTCSSTSEQSVHSTQSNGSESSSSSNISTMLVTYDYTAVKEDEINVCQGEVVQILASNQQNMFLVFRAATDQCPAAE
eukprot:g47412.t1